jgi:histone H3/H4
MIWSDEEDEEEQTHEHKPDINIMEDLKVTLHNCIKNNPKLKNTQITTAALLAITEISAEYFLSIGKDLELFSKHAKRQTINNDDINLLLRNNKSLKKKLAL